MYKIYYKKDIRFADRKFSITQLEKIFLKRYLDYEEKILSIKRKKGKKSILVIIRRKELQERERETRKKKEKKIPTIVRRACFIQGNVLNRNKCGQFYSAEFTHSQDT